MAHTRNFGRFFNRDDGGHSWHGNDGYDRREGTDRPHHTHSVTYQPGNDYYSDAKHHHDAHHQHHHHMSHDRPHEHIQQQVSNRHWNQSYHGNSSNSRFVDVGRRVDNHATHHHDAHHHHMSHDQPHEHIQQQVSNKHWNQSYHGNSSNSRFVDEGRRVDNQEWSRAQTATLIQSTTSQAQHHYKDQSQSHHGEVNRKRKCDDTKGEVEFSSSSSKKLKGPSQQTAGSSQTGFQGIRHDTHVKQLTFVETLPYPAEGMEVLYTNEPDRAESWLQSNIINNSVEAIGLDIEWRPQFIAKKLGGKENKTALIQLSVEESCLVLHIFHMKNLPESLSQVLSDKNILKVGSGINGDVIKLLGDTGLLCDGRVDTQEYARALGIGQGLGLKRLSKEVLDIEMDKPKRISLSNWESFPLKKRQIHYAALDAWISLKLYLKLKEQLDEENKGKEHPKTVQVHSGEPALGKKACKEKKKQWLQDLLSKKPKDKADCSTVRNEGSISSNISENQTPKAAEIGPEESDDDNNANVSQDLHLIRVKDVSQELHLKSIQDKSDSFSSGKSVGGSFSGSIFEKRKSTTAKKEQKGSAAVDGKTVFLLCPIVECKRVKFTQEQDLQEHIKAKHVTCKLCGKLYRSKVSANHKKQHKEQD